MGLISESHPWISTGQAFRLVDPIPASILNSYLHPALPPNSIVSHNCSPYTSMLGSMTKTKSKESKSGASSRCAGCQGSGMKISTRQIGPGNMSACPECRGSVVNQFVICVSIGSGQTIVGMCKGLKGGARDDPSNEMSRVQRLRYAMPSI
ncbi:hypothetical protein C5167_035458 [Papaver somniferum]|uniref:Uncharacterized protein n=1 Tax=Papaver somniferum TaxID=3469 RepID=A0A4Y7KFM7_PAPSO|nr:hypothetical protein C5167_035458 [Papaver somniferum]